MSSHFEAGDPVISITVIDLEFVTRGGFHTDVVDVRMPLFLESPRGSSHGVSRCQWRSPPNRLGRVGRSIGSVLLAAGLPAHAGRFQASDQDAFSPRVLRDIGDLRRFHGSTEFAQ